MSVDCADRSRLGPAAQTRFSSILGVIDHHVSNRRYGTLNLIVPESAATCELLAALMLQEPTLIDATTAQALYVGIATDTGQFRFSSTSHLTFELCCQLVDMGADPAKAALHLYEQEKPARMALLQRFLQSFQFFAQGRICIGTLKLQDFKATGASREDVEGFVDYARSIEGVDIGVLIEETSGGLKGSFRAKDPRFAVHELAAQFNGGGHACAAGFNPHSTLEVFFPQLVAAVENHVKTLTQ
ncbi:MAG: DHHA1 domain-containing protein [Verrucomicrobia bacterium]|nr:DHHA1 domain-containing protein [Verrucomicrobiota bacterium]